MTVFDHRTSRKHRQKFLMMGEQTNGLRLPRSRFSNCLNSKNNSNGTSDSTVKNILDSRRLSTTKPSSPSSTSTIAEYDYQKTLYHYHTNGISNDSKLSPSIVNSLTSPNENLLNPSSTTTNPLDYSSSSSINPSRWWYEFLFFPNIGSIDFWISTKTHRLISLYVQRLLFFFFFFFYVLLAQIGAFFLHHQSFTFIALCVLYCAFFFLSVLRVSALFYGMKWRYDKNKKMTTLAIACTSFLFYL